MPYFLTEGEPYGGTLTFLLPLNLTAGEHALDIATPNHGNIQELRILPAINDEESKLKFLDNSRIYFPGEISHARLTGVKYVGEIVFQQLRLADAGDSDEWGPDIRVVPIKNISRLPVNEYSSDIAFPTSLNGVVGATLIVKDNGKILARYLGSVAVVPHRDTSKYNPEGLFLASTNTRITPDKLRDYKRAGVDWVRVELGCGSFAPTKGKYNWDDMDKLFNACRQEKMTVMTLMGGSPGWMQPKGDFVDVPYKNYTIKLDGSPGREYMSDWECAWREYMTRYTDVNRAMNLWNEPWEGGGISGWKSTGEHYRLQLSHLVSARNAADRTIKIVAADSSHDTDWKIFAANRQDDIDVISTHYEHPRASTAYAMARYYKKEVWETETWLSWQGDAATVRRILYNLALGSRKISLWNDSMLFDSAGNPTPELVTLAATRSMLDGLTFKEIIHPERPPFVLMFTSKNRQVAAISTSLTINNELANREFRGQNSNDAGILSLNEPKENYCVYDISGNPIIKKGDLNDINFIISNNVKYIEFHGSAEKFKSWLLTAKYYIKPFGVVIHDLPCRIEKHPVMNVILKNYYPNILTATVTVQSPDLIFKNSVQKIKFNTGETTLSFPVVSANPVSGNVYQVKVTVTTDKLTISQEELISVATITRGTPMVDGFNTDWQKLKAVPAYILPDRQKTPPLLTPWMPDGEWAKTVETGSSEIAFMADEKYLYMQARVKDLTPHMFPSLLTGKNLHAMQNTPADYIYKQMGPWPERDSDLVELSLGTINRKQWVQKYEVFPPTNPLYRFGAALPCLYTYVFYPTLDGGAEVLRLRTPDFYYAHPLPMDYAWLAKNCRVPGAQVRAIRTEQGYTLEAALPWSELKTLPHKSGDRIRLNVRVRDTNDKFPLAWAGSTEAGGKQYSWSKDRSIAGITALDYTPAGRNQWSADTEWGFE
jgi:hypothetical protein